MTPLTTFRYLSRFHCIADQCEESCCIGWKVQCDQEDFRKLEHSLGATPAGKALLQEKIHHTAPGTALPYAMQSRNGNCPFLDEDRLCQLHKEYGHSILPKVCALFPRTAITFQGETVATGSLACPEIARLLLLDPEAMTPVQLPPRELLPAGLPMIHLDPLPAAPFRHSFHTIRATFFSLLSQTTFPLATRLFIAAYFSHRTRPFFFAGQTKPVTEELARETARILDPALQNALHQQFLPMETPGGLGMNLIQMVVHASRELQGQGRLQLLIHRAATGLDQEDGGDANATQTERFWHAYRRRRLQLDQLLPGKMEGYLERFLQNKVYHLLYIQFDHLLAFWRELLLWTVLLRFLLVGALPFDPETTPPLQASQELDQHAVSMFNAFSKSVEHDSPLIASVRRLLDQAGIDSFAHLVFLIRF